MVARHVKGGKREKRNQRRLRSTNTENRMRAKVYVIKPEIRGSEQKVIVIRLDSRDQLPGGEGKDASEGKRSFDAEKTATPPVTR